MTRTGSKILHGMLLATSAMVASPVIVSTAAMANPAGGSVAVGSATITNPSATQTVINQSSKRALINWNSFSVQSGASVTFNQPNSKSLTVNRVTGPGSSTIDGSLFANGNIWLLNANGILFGKGSQINVGSILATTSELSDADFAAGNNNFTASPNPNASVINQGTINASRGGSVVLSAPTVSNEGMIQADLGTVVLGGAQAFTVDMTGDNLLRYEIAAPVTQTPTNSQGSPALALVSNSGTISAAGGHVVMTARAAQNVQDNVINNTGMVEATSVSAHDGEIDLDAGPDGTANVGGAVDASGSGSGQTGGTVTVTGGTVNVADGANINVSGNAGGGTVLIGGGPHGAGTLAHAQRTIIGAGATVNADATGNGNGGNVTVWSDGTTQFNGAISSRGGALGGNGGQVETSGANLHVASTATVNTSAPLGLTGDWLLDPTNINITSSGGEGIGSPNSCVTISNGTINTALGSSNVTLEATSNINVSTNASINWSSGSSLSLLSDGNISIQSSIQGTGAGALNIVAGWDGSTGVTGSYNGSQAVNITAIISGGKYGGSCGSISIGSACGSVSVGSASGLTTLAGANITIDPSSGNTARIGYAGLGGGDIDLLARDNISLDASAGGATNSVLIGNGIVSGCVSGSVTGNISITANEDLTFSPGSNGTIFIGDGTLGGMINGSVSGNIDVDAVQAVVINSGPGIIVGNSGGASAGNVTFVTGTSFGIASTLQSSLVADVDYGDVFVGFTANTPATFFPSAGNYDGSHNLTVASDGDLVVATSVQNSGSGNITLVSGWNGTSTTFAANAPAAWGNNNHTLTIGGVDAGGDVAVGSANGLTTLFGGNVTISAQNGNTRLGYAGSGTGDIDIQAHGNVTVAAPGTYTATIGGGESSSGASTGNLTINAGGDILFHDYGSASGIQIGNEAQAPKGDITITAGGNITLHAAEGSYGMKVGNFGTCGTVSGNITMVANGSAGIQLTLTAAEGAIFVGNYGNPNTTVEGNVTVTANDGGVSLISNVTPGFNPLVEIGNFGSGADAVSGDVHVTANGSAGISLLADLADDVVQIGDHGADSTGPVTGNVTLTTPNGLNLTSYQSTTVQIGNSNPDNGASGDVSVTAGGIADLSNSCGTIAIGNTANGSISGNLTFTAASVSENNSSLENNILADIVGGDVTVALTDPGATLTFNTSASGSFDSAHNLSLLSAGNVEIDSSIQNSGSGNVTLIGGWDGTTTNFGSLAFNATSYGVNSSSYIQINPDISVGSAGGTTLVAGGDITVSDSQIGYNDTNGVSGTGNITVFATGYVDIYGSADHGGQIGHGGLNSNGVNSGDILVEAADSGDNRGYVLLEGQTGFTQIGHGGSGSNANGSETNSGNITVIADSNVELLSGNASGAYAQIGHGGLNSNTGLNDGNSGNITVTVLTGDVDLFANSIPDNNADNIYTQIGSGGASTGNVGSGGTGYTTDTGNINVTAVQGSVILDGNLNSSIQTGYAVIGETGTAIKTGNISVNAGTDVTLTGGAANQDGIGNAFALIGDANQGNITADVSVTAGGNLTLAGGTGSADYAQVGNADNSNDTVQGDITVNITGATKIINSIASDDTWIGNVPASGANNGSGKTTIITGTLDTSGDVLGDTAITLDNDLNNGDVSIKFTNQTNTNLGFLNYDSANNLTIASTANLNLTDAITNCGTGSISLAAGGTQTDTAGNLTITGAVTTGGSSGINNMFEAGDSITIHNSVDAGAGEILMHAGEETGDGNPGAILDPLGNLLTADAIRLVNDKGGTSDQTIGTSTAPIYVATNHLAVATAQDDIYISSAAEGFDVGDGFFGIYGHNITLTANGSITQTDPGESLGIAASGTLTVNVTGSGHDIALKEGEGSGIGNEITGNVNLNSADGNVSFTNTETTWLQSVHAGDNFDIEVTNANQDADDNGDAKLILVGTVTADGSGTSTLHAAGDIVNDPLQDPTGTYDPDSNPANVETTVTADGLSLVSDNGSVGGALPDDSTTFLLGTSANYLHASTGTSGGIDISNNKSFVIGISEDGAGLSVGTGGGYVGAANGTITQMEGADGKIVGSDLAFGANTSFALNNVNNQVGGDLTLYAGSGQSDSFTNSGNTTIGGIAQDLFDPTTVGGNVTLTVLNGAITQDGALYADNLTVSASGGNAITLNNANNTITGKFSAIASGEIAFTNNGTITAGEINGGMPEGPSGATFPAGNVTLTAITGDINITGNVYSHSGDNDATITLIAPGNITQVHNADLDGDNLVVSGANITLLNDNDIVGPGTVNITATGDAAFGNNDNTVLGETSVAGNLSVLSEGNLTVSSDIINSGNSSIQLVAGWDGSSAPVNITASANTTWGQHDGDVIIGGVLNDGENVHNVSVGTANGTTSIYGNNITLTAAESYTSRIGYAAGGNGTINVYAGHDVSITTFNSEGAAGTAIIGNGDGGVSDAVGGNITVKAGHDVLLSANEGSLSAIGNWGGGATVNGTIQITAGGNISVSTVGEGNPHSDGQAASARIGNENASDTGSADGDITVGAGSDVSVYGEGAIAQIGNYGHGQVSGTINVTAAGAVIVYQDYFGQAQIGNYGYNDSANGTYSVSGDITVTANGTDGVELTTGGEGFAQIGNVGVLAGNATGQTSGNVTVTANHGGVSLYGEGGESIGSLEGGAQIGNYGTASASGDIIVAANGGDLDVEASGGESVLQIGNSADQANGSIGGNVTVSTSGNLTVNSDASGAVAQIGNGQSNDPGSVSGEISVNATGNITVSASSSHGTYAMIGNGDADSLGTVSGNVTLGAGGDISVESGNTALAAVGNYGGGTSVNGTLNITANGALRLSLTSGDDNEDGPPYGSLIGNYNSCGTVGGNIIVSAASVALHGESGVVAIGNYGDGTGVSGAINVTTSGSVVLSSAESGSAWIGNDGFNDDIVVGGDISIVANGTNGIELSTGGEGSLARVGNFVQGDGTQVSGNITVTANKGGIILSASGLQSDVVIGNTGFGDTDPDISGDVIVAADGGDLDVKALDPGTVAQIGNGGNAAGGTTGGNLTVSTSGNLTLLSQSEGSVAHIGNGGYKNDGPIGGNINITATGNVSISATGEGSYALVGNGDATGQGTGSVSGDINLTAGNMLEFDSEGGGTSWLGNIGSKGDGDIESGNVTVTFKSESDLDDASFGAMVTADLGESGQTGSGGNVFVGATSSEGHIGGDTFDGYNSPNTLTIATKGNLNVTSNIQNDGSGAINLVAGWDGATYALASLASSGVYGNSNGSVNIGGSDQVAVGSADGATTVEGANITLNGANGSAQIGYIGSGSGDITVLASQNVLMEAGDCEACYVQIGDGTVSSDLTESGNVSVHAQGNITLTAGEDAYAYAQIGNGGDSSNGTFGGDINVTAGGALSLTGSGDYAQIGNAGWGVDGDASGNISVNVTGNLSLQGGGDDAFGYAQIGHGGQTASGNYTGNITVATGGSIQLATVPGSLYAQIGNGGEGTSGNATGNISVTAVGPIMLDAGANFEYAQIGNGGLAANGTIGGDISINATSNITLNTTATQSVAEIGNLGGTNSSQSGNITVSSNGTLSLNSSSGGSYAHLGNWANADTNGTSSGDITLNVSAVSLFAAGEAAFAEIGNGNFHAGNNTGAVSGNITIGAGAVSLTANGSEGPSQARIGDLGYGSSDGNLTLNVTGNIVLSASDNGLVNVGNVGDASTPTSSGNLFVQSGGNISLLVANGGDARIENGGAQSGNITVTAADDILLQTSGTSGDVDSYALIGSVAGATGNETITVTSTSGNISLTAGAPDSVAQIGSGLAVPSSAASENITVSAANGSVNFAGTGAGAVSEIATSTPGVGAVNVTATALTTSGTAEVAGNSANIVVTGSGNNVANANAPLLVTVNDLAIQTNNGSAYIGSPGQGLSIGIGSNGVNLGSGSFFLNANGPVTQSQSILAASLNVTASSIALTNAGNTFNTASLTSSGDASLTDSTAMTIASANVTGNLTLLATAVNQTGAIAASGLNVTASNGTIVLTNTGNAINTASLTSPGDISLTDSKGLIITGATAGGNLTLTAASLGQSGAVTANKLTVTASNGSIALSNSGNTFSTALLTSSGNAALTDSVGMTVLGANVTGNLTLLATSINQTGAINSAGLNATASNGTIVLTNAGNAISTASLTSPGDITLTDSKGLTITGATAGGNLTLTAASLAQSGAIKANALTVTASNGSIALTNTGNTFSTATLTSSGDASLTDSTAMTVASANVVGNLTVAATSINQTGTIAAAGLIATASNGSIVLTNTGNTIGAASLTASGDASLTDSTGVTVSGGNVAGNLTLIATSIGQSGAAAAGTLIATASNGSIALTNAGNSFGTALLTSPGNIALTDSKALTVTGATAGGNLTLTAASLAQSGALTANALNATATNGNIVLTNTGNTFGTASLTSSGDATLTDSTGVTLSGGNVAGNLTLVATSIGQSGAVTAHALIATASNGSIALNNAGNAIGAASLTSPGDITLTDSKALSITSATAGGNLALAGASLSQTGALKANALSVTASNGSISLTNAGNTFNTASVTSSGDAALTDSTAVTVSGASVTGDLTLVATSINQTGAIDAGGLNATASNGSIALTNTGNAIGAASLTSPGDASLTDSTGLTVSGGSVTGNLTLIATSIEQSGGVKANTLIATASNGSIALTSTGNAITDASLTATGDAALTDTGALTVTGASAGGNLTLTAASLAQTGTLTADALVATASNGSIALTNAGNSLADATLTSSGDTTLYDAVGLTVTGASVGGNLTLLTKGDLTFASSAQLTNGSLLAVAGWDGTTTSPSALSSGSAYGNNGGDITIGGSGVTGGVSVGSKSGSTTLAADDLVLSAINGYAQVGYHGGGSGAITVNATGDVTLNGGAGTAYFAQIGDGGYQVSGSNNATVSVLANGNVTLQAGSGQEAYAQIGNGGAESNSNSSGYTNTGAVTVHGNAIALNAGSGNAGYAQIGDGGYKSGQSLNGAASVGSDIVIASVSGVTLNGNAADAYAQIGNGGDFINTGSAGGSSGTIGGNITVAVSTPAVAGNAVVALAGSGANSYAQIGNGGNGENSAGTGTTVTYNISGNITVNDLVLTGSNAGSNGYAQVGNGDAAHSGTGNVSGDITISQGTVFNLTPGTAPGTSTNIQNGTGTGTVSGTVTGYNSTSPTSDPTTAGSVSTILQNNNTPTDYIYTASSVAPSIAGPTSDFTASGSTSSGPAPLEKLAGEAEGEDVPSDGVVNSVGDSLNGGSKTHILARTIIPGVLDEIITLTPTHPQGVPPADEDYSSWGNEALWRW